MAVTDLNAYRHNKKQYGTIRYRKLGNIKLTLPAISQLISEPNVVKQRAGIIDTLNNISYVFSLIRTLTLYRIKEQARTTKTITNLSSILEPQLLMK